MKKHIAGLDKAGYAFVLPVVLLMVLLIIYPMCYGVYISFFNTNLVSRWQFVGLRYYIDAFREQELYTSLFLTFRYMICVVLGHFIVGFFLASLLNKAFWGRTVFRVIFTLPWFFPEAVIALLFSWILNPIYGVLNSVLMSLGLISGPLSWLGSSNLALPSVIAASIWKGFPLVMTMILAGFQTIPKSLYEAAEIDGVGPVRRLFFITLPSLKPILSSVLVLDSVWWFKQYTLVYTMTSGGPGRATSLISLSIYGTAFNDLRFGKGAAWGILVFLVCWLITHVYKATLKEESYEA